MQPAKLVRKNFQYQQTRVPTLNGKQWYINFDNAASTPSARSVLNTLTEAARWYSNIHRGTGYKSWLSSEWYDQSKAEVLRFVGAGREDVVIYGKNASEAANLLAATIPAEPGDIALVGLTEHHSNLLPWKQRFQVEFIPIDHQGSVDMVALEKLLDRYGKKVKVIAVTAASNVTGAMTPLGELSRLAKRVGAQTVVDVAQLIAHRPLNKKKLGIDFLFFSAHKMYAPWGTGALVGPADFFNNQLPWQSGGGTIQLVTPKTTLWDHAPARFEAGTPTILGAIALGRAIRFIEELGWDYIRQHEQNLLDHFMNRWKSDPWLQEHLTIYGADLDNRVSVLPFNIKECNPFLASAILSTEGGIGTRPGCFCAHPYVLALLGYHAKDWTLLDKQMQAGDRRAIPGMVRASFGVYNTTAEIDHLFKYLRLIAQKKWKGEYKQSKKTGFFTATQSLPTVISWEDLMHTRPH